MGMLGEAVPAKDYLKDLKCPKCPVGAGGMSCRQGSSIDMYCGVSLEVTGSYWIPIALARTCLGPDHMRERLVQGFMNEG